MANSSDAVPPMPGKETDKDRLEKKRLGWTLIERKQSK